MRIIRAARLLGLTTIQAHSEADADMLAVRMADEAAAIGPPQASRSYLDVARVVEAAREARADAVHPGYGFLSESAAFAEAVESAGMIFVGPAPETIRRMGDKAAAREAAIAAGVPVVPGSDGRVEGARAAGRDAERIGYPVMVKAAAGGGGRGIRIAHNAAELARLVPEAQAEATAAFGDGGLYLERLMAEARHVEVQVLGDGERVVHLFERECSLQRKRQKVWEEAPAACLDEATRARLCEASLRLAEAVGYRGAGTLEYLHDERTGEFFFIEMNTRIQVEHPVTEAITGVDLVQAMIRIAFGEPLWLTQEDVVRRGHAIEVRVNAEDPANSFMPFPGVAGAISMPEDVRFDTMLYEGYAVPPFYDSLLGKLIVHAPNREGAIEALRRALAGMRIDGLKTTLALHAALARDPAVVAGRVHTRFLEPWLDANPLEPL